MLKIKVCGMKYQENVKQVAALEPDLLGFIFYPRSSRFVGEDPPMGLFESVPPHIRKTGVFVNSDFSFIVKTSRKFGLQVVQLHGNESPELAAQLRNEGLDVIKAIHVASVKDLGKTEQYRDCVNYFLFEAPSGTFGGSGIKFPWQILESYKWEIPFFLSGGISPGDEDRILTLSLSMKHLAGADINSRFEIQPGLKDTGKLKIFIEAIKKAEK